MTASTRTRRPRIGLWLGLVAIGLLGIVAVGRNDGRGGRLDPEGTSPAGAKGLVLLLESFGADVDVVAAPDRDHEIALVLSDRLGERGSLVVDDWVDGGGVLVVADPSSMLAAQPLGLIDGEHGFCDLEAVSGLDRIDADQIVRLEVDFDDASCFGDRSGAAVVSRWQGAGVVVSVGGPNLFTNEWLASADNAALATTLLVPRPGVRVAFVHGSLAGAGQRGLADLVDEGIKWGLVQLGIAFVVFALAKGRRLGRPIEEDLPVPLAGSELTGAVGTLLDRTGRPGDIARRSQERLYHDLVGRMGLSSDVSIQVVAETTARRTSVSADEVVDVLGRVVTDDQGLVDLAQRIARIREDVVIGRARRPSPADQPQEVPHG